MRSQALHSGSVRRLEQLSQSNLPKAAKLLWAKAYVAGLIDFIILNIYIISGEFDLARNNIGGDMQK